VVILLKRLACKLSCIYVRVLVQGLIHSDLTHARSLDLGTGCHVLSLASHTLRCLQRHGKVTNLTRIGQSVADLSAPVSPSTYFVRARIHVIGGGLHFSGAEWEGTSPSELANFDHAIRNLCNSTPLRSILSLQLIIHIENVKRNRRKGKGVREVRLREDGLTILFRRRRSSTVRQRLPGKPTSLSASRTSKSLLPRLTKFGSRSSSESAQIWAP
jgi:hypothetical protein